MDRGHQLEAIPRIEVLGVYLPSADRERYEKFISDSVANISELSSEDRAIISKLRKGINLDEELRSAALEFEETLRLNLSEVALIEILVTDPDQNFRMDGFVQQDFSAPQNLWQAAWNELFLSLDGEQVVADRWQGPPKERILRVVFYVHFWKHALGLQSCYGPLNCPGPQAMPERLWKLAPYEVP
jgi:hypothetical protein